MQRTLKRELKVPEIVKEEPVTTACVRGPNHCTADDGRLS